MSNLLFKTAPFEYFNMPSSPIKRSVGSPVILSGPSRTILKPAPKAKAGDGTPAPPKKRERAPPKTPKNVEATDAPCPPKKRRGRGEDSNKEKDPPQKSKGSKAKGKKAKK